MLHVKQVQVDSSLAGYAGRVDGSGHALFLCRADAGRAALNTYVRHVGVYFSLDRWTMVVAAIDVTACCS